MTKATGPLYSVHFRRRREGRTDYAKRLALLKSGKARMVVRKTTSRVIVQFSNYDEKGDAVITSATSGELKEYGFSPSRNTPAAYLTGMLASRKAMKKGLKEFVLDIGLHAPSKGSVVFAALKGALDAGLSSPHSDDKVPTEERISGAHLGEKVSSAFKATKEKIAEL